MTESNSCLPVTAFAHAHAARVDPPFPTPDSTMTCAPEAQDQLILHLCLGGWWFAIPGMLLGQNPFMIRRTPNLDNHKTLVKISSIQQTYRTLLSQVFHSTPFKKHLPNLMLSPNLPLNIYIHTKKTRQHVQSFHPPSQNSLQICQAVKEKGFRGQNRAPEPSQGSRPTPHLRQWHPSQLPLQGGAQRTLSFMSTDGRILALNGL